LILASSEAARFAVGYIFLSGLTPVAEKLDRVKELRLLIGNTTNRETLEQLAEGYRRLEMVADAVEAQAFPKRTEAKRMADETGEDIRLRAGEPAQFCTRESNICGEPQIRVFGQAAQGGRLSGRPA
jgi:hypothetical protein